MAYRVLRIFVMWVTAALTIPSASPAIESLTNHAMDHITGQATAQQSNEDRETAYTVATEVHPPDDTLHPVLPKPTMAPSTLDGDHTNTVILDFLGVEANERLGTDAEDFNGEVEVGNIFYLDEDTQTYVHLHGTFFGEFVVPSTYDDGSSFKTIRVSKERLDDVYPDGNYLLSYQGSTYMEKDLIDETSYRAYPNRQAQTVAKTGERPLHLLIPHGEGDSTQWRLFTTIPAETDFIQIDINRLVTRNSGAYTVKLSNNAAGLNAGNVGAAAGDYSGTLGTLYFSGETLVEGGTVVITTTQ
ncbi:hypothetical protein [Desulfoluna spongiiphila]|uniref:Uncharacterized protein n=1 Tax=Desulfoluna spongiiphila TaxID=419481 RepID=A0A1G5DCI9_9BACT|nr:hypothetical protein [Desulfoluna spongiiphila]SCY12425.1 hypothetical protein SAMN05216233_104111 [Desulfoluna spongiiphila]